MNPSRRFLSLLLAVSCVGTICIAEALPTTAAADNIVEESEKNTTIFENVVKENTIDKNLIELESDDTSDAQQTFAAGIEAAKEKAAQQEAAARAAEELAAKQAAEKAAKKKAAEELRKQKAAAVLASGMSGGTLSGSMSQVIAYAEAYLGTPYAYGGASASGFDCSGFTMFVFKQFGYSLPHGATEQLAYGTAVDKADLQPGDLVFFGRNGISSTKSFHVGIYIGNGQFIHSSSYSSGGVIISSLSSNYYSTRYMAARRLA